MNKKVFSFIKFFLLVILSGEILITYLGLNPNLVFAKPIYSMDEYFSLFKNENLGYSDTEVEVQGYMKDEEENAKDVLYKNYGVTKKYLIENYLNKNIFMDNSVETFNSINMIEIKPYNYPYEREDNMSERESKILLDVFYQYKSDFLIDNKKPENVEFSDIMDINAVFNTHDEVIKLHRGNKVLSINIGDLRTFAKIIHCEANGEGLEGKIAVANVVLNRCFKQNKSIKDIVYAKNQFEPVMRGLLPKTKPIYSDYEAVYLSMFFNRVSQDAYFFCNPKTSQSSWIMDNRPLEQVIKHHAFYK